MAVTYDQLINGDDAYIKRIARAYEQKHGHPMGETDLAHNIWRLLREGWTIEAVLQDISGDDAPIPPSPPPVPPSTVDLLSWPRRGATIAQSLLDTRWDIEAWASMLGSIFAGRGLTQVNVLSALWPEPAPHMQHPFTQEPDGRWNLRRINPLFYDRLARSVEVMNQQGVVVQLCFLELYSWSYRKPNVPFDKHLSPFRHNVNGVNWKGSTRAEDDATLAMLPDAFLLELIERVVMAVKGAGVAFLPGNEFPEKPVHLKIAHHIKSLWPEARIVTNRNEDTPGQYANMQVGQGTIDMIAFHGWDDLGFLLKAFTDEPIKRPRTFRQFFDNVAQNGDALGVDYARVIASSDGSRSSDDPINTYNWPELLKVFAFVAGKGGSIEHQSRAKMTPGARLDTVEVDFLRRIAAL